MTALAIIDILVLGLVVFLMCCIEARQTRHNRILLGRMRRQRDEARARSNKHLDLLSRVVDYKSCVAGDNGQCVVHDEEGPCPHYYAQIEANEGHFYPVETTS